ncbi:hypothetical protein OUZ56_027461 [Daphnia magna]|uniref:Uncharacterized protein n=1 Tax=Daphnia magna TaxID=35525 RepID=A0ABQ9ZR64_9CRUS|nr:hypothetical protein OUZ56_027461 [Daphnia magna]
MRLKQQMSFMSRILLPSSSYVIDDEYSRHTEKVSRILGFEHKESLHHFKDRRDMENGRFDANLSLFAGLFVELGDHVLFPHSKSSFDPFLKCVSRFRVSHEENLNA